VIRRILIEYLGMHGGATGLEITPLLTLTSQEVQASTSGFRAQWRA
jgi:hypothetical protein